MLNMKTPHIEDIFLDTVSLIREKHEESIFDADGFCYDLKRLKGFKPLDELHFLLEYKESKKLRQTICTIEYMEVLCNKHNRYNLIAWRPLPPIPSKGDKNV